MSAGAEGSISPDTALPGDATGAPASAMIPGMYDDVVPMPEADESETIVAEQRVSGRARMGLGGSFGRRGRRDMSARRRAERTASAPAEEPAPTEPADGASAGEPEPSVAKDPPHHGHHIVYTATMQIGVFDLEEAVQKAEAIPEAYGGYIQSMGGGQLVLRIPSKHLRAAMSDLGGFGNVESRSLQAQDVTAEYVDLESRIRVLRETQNQLVELLKKARTVEEALRVRQSLDQITMQLEQALGRLRQLQNMVGFSTLTLTLVERGPHQPTPTSNDPFPWVDTLGVESTEWRN
jgi:hypothetical protein